MDTFSERNNCFGSRKSEVYAPMAHSNQPEADESSCPDHIISISKASLWRGFFAAEGLFYLLCTLGKSGQQKSTPKNNYKLVLTFLICSIINAP
jgi:hypothetical protein